ncbi:LacI family DNA-binding transcriptional regulator [Leifsonia poae]|uniref:LacI family DNA-binding transcriptional regulator n=1 Tax=Leifsonia poae TaxID=110933 RepID=UPI003D6652C7
MHAESESLDRTPEAPRVPTVYDVAERAGVSIASVSRVFRQPESVRAETRSAVLAASSELGYLPSGNARALAAKRTGALGVVFPGMDESESLPELVLAGESAVTVTGDDSETVTNRNPDQFYHDLVLRGSELQSWHRGYALHISAARGRTEADLERTISDMGGRVDGIAVFAASLPDELIQRIARRIPVVLIAGEPRGDDFDHVTVANREGMAALTTHVVRTHGIHDLMYLAGPADSPDDAERFDGFRSALVAEGINPDSIPVLRAGFTRSRAYAVAEDLVQSERLPRALICANDQMAFGALDAFRTHGVRVPDEVMVTGFDGLADSRQSDPPLTTVYQPMADVGRSAIELLVDRLGDRSLPPRSVRLPVTLVLRASTEGR